MSRRSKRRRDPGTAGRQAGAAASGASRDRFADAPGTERSADAPVRRGESAPGWGLGVQIAFLAAVFGVVVVVAELAGAAKHGVALGIGQIAFTIAVVYLLVRR